MTRKILFGLAAALTVLVVGWTALAGIVYVLGGFATVRLAEADGAAVTLPVPMAAVETVVGAALGAGQAALVDHQPAPEVELGAVGPVLAAVLTALADCPDATLVEVVDGDDRVRVVKRDRRIRVEVADRDIDLAVSLPARAAARLAKRRFG